MYITTVSERIESETKEADTIWQQDIKSTGIMFNSTKAIQP